MAKVVAELVVDGQQVFIRQLDEAERAVGGVGDGAEKSSRKLSGMTSAMAALGGALATRELAQWGQDAANYAIQLGAMQRKADTVFDAHVADIRAFSAEHASRFGLAEDALTGLAAGYGDLLVPMGFSRRQAAELTEQTLQLAGALGEWSPQLGGAQHALEALGAAMTGEREQLKAYGIVIDEAAVQAELLARGQQDLTGEAERQAKALATLDLALRGSTDAQAAFTSGGDPAIVAAAESRAAYEEFRAELGENLIPVMSSAMGLLADVTGFFSDLPEPVQTAGLALAGIGAAAVPIASTVRAAKDLGFSFEGLDRSARALRIGGLAAATVGLTILTTRLSDARAAADTFASGFVEGLGTDDPEARLRALREEAERLGAIATEGFDVEAFGVRIVGDQNRKDTFDQLDAINREIAAIEAQLAGASAAADQFGGALAVSSDVQWDLADASHASMGAAVAQAETMLQVPAAAYDSAIQQAVRAQQDLARETQTATMGLQQQRDMIRGIADPFFAASAAQQQLADAQKRAAEADTSAERAAAQDDVARAALGLHGALIDLDQAQNAGETSARQFGESLDLLEASGIVAEGALDSLIAKYRELEDAANDANRAMLGQAIQSGTAGYPDAGIRGVATGQPGYEGAGASEPSERAGVAAPRVLVPSAAAAPFGGLNVGTLVLGDADPSRPGEARRLADEMLRLVREDLEAAWAEEAARTGG